MKISWLGHSSFMLDFNGYKIVTDPYDDSVGYTMPRLAANAVICSHGHGDHSCLSNVKGSYELVNTTAERTCGGVRIFGVPCFHDSEGGRLRGGNIAFKLTYGGVSLCHAGDIGEYSPNLVHSLGKVDILLIPVGGYYTVDAATAKKYVDALCPAAVIPMHYKTAECTYPIAGVDKFTSLFGGDQVQYVNNEIEFNKESLPAATTVFVFKDYIGRAQ